MTDQGKNLPQKNKFAEFVIDDIDFGLGKPKKTQEKFEKKTNQDQEINDFIKRFTENFIDDEIALGCKTINVPKPSGLSKKPETVIKKPETIIKNPVIEPKKQETSKKIEFDKKPETSLKIPENIKSLKNEPFLNYPSISSQDDNDSDSDLDVENYLPY